MGAGKLSVIRVLQEEDITMLDCDAVSTQLLQKHEEGYTALIQMFGTGILNDEGNIMHQRMSDLIFCNFERKRQTGGASHPLIRRRIFGELALYAKEPIVVVEAPLFFKIRWEDASDGVWVVAYDEGLLLSRLKLYRHTSKEEALRRLWFRLPQQEKTKCAGIVFYNSSDSVSLKRQICGILSMKRQLR